jgi:predicted ATP-binding protein involved in virulence
MKINSLKIENLFEIFNYDISFEKKGNILIITGPNGFGKTTVLNIIDSLFNRKFLFFHKLIFEKITLSLDEDITIVISKQEGKEGEKHKISFAFFEDKKEIEKFNYTDKLESDIERSIERYLPVRRLDIDKWVDHSTDRILNFEDLLSEYAERLPEEVRKNILRIKSERVNAILDSIPVHLIREQRLFKKVRIAERNYRKEIDQSVIIESIQTYSVELVKVIKEFSEKFIYETQELDSSYPKRLTNENNILKQNDYETQYNVLKIKQEKLIRFGLSDRKQEFLDYNSDDAKALSVYLKDLDAKLSVFDELVKKLELFTNILNERRFTFKSIKINKTQGFYFETDKGKALELGQLSSGEQHEVVLLYELIFNVKPNILVLLDEPEISLHITWQKEFLNDLIKIIKIQNIQVLIASHSPSIINDRWDLVYNLETK